MTFLDYYLSVRGSLDYDLHSHLLFKRSLKCRSLGDVDSKYYSEMVSGQPILAPVSDDINDQFYKNAYIVRPSLELVEDQRKKLHSECVKVANKRFDGSASGRISCDDHGQMSYDDGLGRRLHTAPDRARLSSASRQAQSRPTSHAQSRPTSHAQSRPASHVQSRPTSHRSAINSQRSKTTTPHCFRRSLTALTSAGSPRPPEPSDRIYSETARALSENRARIKSHLNDKNRVIGGGVFTRGQKRAKGHTSAGSSGPKQFLTFGGGVKSSAGVVDSFAVMKNPEEYYAIECQTGMAVAKHMRKMDKVIIGINGKATPAFADRLDGRRMTESYWYDKDQIEDLIRQADALTVDLGRNGLEPLCWDAQIAAPAIKMVTPTPTPRPEAAKSLLRDTRPVVFQKLETEPARARAPLVGPPINDGFRVQRRTKTLTKSRNDYNTLMTIVSIDREKIDAESTDYDAFIDDKIPTRQFTRRHPTPEPEFDDAAQWSSPPRPSDDAYNIPARRSSQTALVVRPSSRSITMKTIDDDSFAVTPHQGQKSVNTTDAATSTPPKQSNGRLYRGKASLGRTAPTIPSPSDNTDSAYIKISESLVSPTRGTTAPALTKSPVKELPSKPPSTPTDGMLRTTAMTVHIKPATSTSNSLDMAQGRGSSVTRLTSNVSDTDVKETLSGAQELVAPAPSLADETEQNEEASKTPPNSAREHFHTSDSNKNLDTSEVQFLSKVDKNHEATINIPVASEEQDHDSQTMEVEQDGRAEIERRRLESNATDDQAELSELEEDAGTDDPSPTVDGDPSTLDVKKQKRLRFEI